MFCTAPHCDRPHCAKGLCNTHYRRLYRNGTLIPKKPWNRFVSQTRECRYCGGHFVTSPFDSRFKKYCSRTCAGRTQIGVHRKMSATAKERIRRSKIGARNPMWKGNAVGYGALHDWGRKWKPRPALCEHCQRVPPHDLANLSGKYLRNVSDWAYLCRRCHMIQDGRLKRFVPGKGIINQQCP